MIFRAYYPSPVGTLAVVCGDRAVLGVGPADGMGENIPSPLTGLVYAQLCEYFGGRRKVFDLPLEPAGTEFQRKVWQALCEIPYGETRSYGEIARAVGNPNASRAVGAANHRNPIMIMIPCHRVIGASGALVGYGGGLPMKQYLLELEKQHR